MQVVQVHVGTDHPVAEFTERHREVRVDVEVQATTGSSFTYHRLQAGTDARTAYRDVFPPGPDGCADLEVEAVRDGAVTFIRGPCRCQGSYEVCREIGTLESLCQDLASPLTRLLRLTFRDGDCLGLAQTVGNGSVEPGARTPCGRLEVEDVIDPGNVAAPDASLTAAERRTLEAAVAHGYFDEPRGCSLDDLADVLDVSKSTVHRRIKSVEQTAVRRFRESLGSAGDGAGSGTVPTVADEPDAGHVPHKLLPMFDL